MIAMALVDGPRTLSEIEDNFYAFARRSGLYLEAGRHAGVLASELVHEIDDMIAEGQIALADGRYSLTDQGRREAEMHLLQMRQVGRWIRSARQPETATRVAVGIHLALAAIKLPAGLLSGSVGLLNDAADTLLDGVASVLAFLGVRYGRERAVNVILVVLMLGTGLLTLWEAIRRLLEPQGPGADMPAFVAAVISGATCGILGIYQRYVGLQSGSLALITQSVDSRNHVVVAIGVLLGLIASRLGLLVADALVGLGVALLILRSGVDVVGEMLRSFKDEQIDVSRYEPGVVGRLSQLRREQLRDWMVYLIGKGLVQTRDDLMEQARQAQDFARYPALRELGLAGGVEHEQAIVQAVTELESQGWVVGETRLAITDAGRAHLQSAMQRPRRAMRRGGHRRPV
jgi:cation diffusion facilitator family transporter